MMLLMVVGGLWKEDANDGRKETRRARFCRREVRIFVARPRSMTPSVDISSREP